jgi:AcrR family transcriptional regulator
MARTPRGDRSRSAIISAGAELFADRGFANTSIDEVLSSIGLTKGAFYFHFPRKEALALAVCASYRDWLVGLQERARRDEPDPLRRIVPVLTQAALAYRQDPVARATTRLLEESNQLDLPYLTPLWVPWWSATLADAQARGQLDPTVEVDRLAWMLTAAWYGSQSNSHAESQWRGLPMRVADLLGFALLPAISCPESAQVLRSELDRLAQPERETVEPVAQV